MQEVRWEEIFSRRKLIKREAANPFEKLNNMVYAILEEAIISYSIPAGTKLSIVHIADLMNISRTPVKEALEKLREKGLVVTEKEKKGYYVFDMSHGSLEQLFMARKALEGTAAFLCAQRNFDVDLKALERLTKLIGASFEKQYFNKFSLIDQAFHSLIIDPRGNPLIIRMYKSIEKINSYYSMRSQEYICSKCMDDSFKAIVGQHIAIYRAIEMGIPGLAETAAKSHLDAGYILCLRYHTSMGNNVI